jgi:glycosyltransferase involved in cell wall biosynthesis
LWLLEPTPRGVPGQPRTVLLIPHHDDRAGLLSSIESIQELEAVDVLIVDDGSLVETVELSAVEQVFSGTGRLHLLRLATNQGIEHALNVGLQWIVDQGYEFVARLDCGDRNRPGRIGLQQRFLDLHPEALLVGGAAVFVDLGGVPIFVARMPRTAQQISARLRFNSPFVHSTVMLRTAAVASVGFYPRDFPAAEDYAWFWRWASHGPLANLEAVLVEYEVDPNSISNSRSRAQLRSRIAIQVLHFDGSPTACLGLGASLLRALLTPEIATRAKRLRH